ncbi:YcxB family protein [Streptomyces sp. NPDC001226]
MIESWVIDDGSGAPVSSDTVREMLRARIDKGQLETWLASSSGRLLAFVTNHERAMMSLLDDEADPGEHAVDPEAVGSSEGFVLSNGQHDEYPNEDTVPLEEASLGRGDHGPDSTGFLCLGVGVMYVLLLTLGTRMGVKKQASRLCKPTQVLLTANRFTIETDLERGEFKWAAIVKIRETSEAFLLHPSPRLFIVIPKRAFAPEQLTEFSGFVAGRGAVPPNSAPVVQERVSQ